MCENKNRRPTPLRLLIGQRLVLSISVIKKLWLEILSYFLEISVFICFVVRMCLYLCDIYHINIHLIYIMFCVLCIKIR